MPVYVLVIAICAFSLSAFAGCKKRITITVNTMFGTGDNHNAVFTKINSDFTKNTKHKIVDKSEYLSANAKWQTDLVAQINSGEDVPDIIYFFSGASIDPIKDNLVSFSEIYNYDTDYGKNIKMNTGDGYGLAIKIGSQAIMYNTDHFESDDFSSKNSMLSAIADATVKPAASGHIPHYWLNHLMAYYLGIDEYKRLNGTAAFFDEDTKELWAEALMNTLNDMRAIGFHEGADVDYNEETNHFWAGTRSLSIDGQWVAGAFEEAAAKSKLEFASFPKDKDNKSFYIGGVTSGWYITKSGWENESKRKVIIDYIKAHTTDQALNDYCVAGGGAPANKKALTGATTAVTGFASVTMDSEPLVAIDDRVNSEAKGALMGGDPRVRDENGNIIEIKPLAGATKLLAQEDPVSLADATALLDEVIAKLS